MITTPAFAALLASIVLATTAAAEPSEIVVRLKAGSPTATTWIAQHRTGSLASLQAVVGPHTTAPFLLDATLVCYQGALDRRMGFRRDRSDAEQPWLALPLARTAIIRCDRDARHTARKLASHPDIERADVMPVYTLVAEPNDTLYPAQWHLGMIQAAKAWESLPADKTAVVAIVDTGIQFDHPDLLTQTAENSGETGVDDNGNDRRTNGIDDDRNGFVDDWRGWDFVSASTPAQGDNNPTAGNSHGTHVAGIVAAATNNLIGVAGTALHTKVLPIKVGADNPNSRTVERTADAIMYAASMGVDVINCSFGSASQSFADEDVVTAATELGTLVVGAAGNDGNEQASYPAAYDNALSVAASGTSDRLTFFSNRHRTVDVTAPGQSILSTVTGSTYERFDGTSMASPVVAGVAAMVKLMQPTASPDEIRAILKATAWNIDTLNPFALGRLGTGRVDAYAAVNAQAAAWADVVSATFADENADGLFAPGERAVVSLLVKNTLRPLSNASIRVRLVPAAFAAIILRDGGTVGPFATGQIRTINDAVEVELPDDVPMNGSLDLLVEILDEGRVVGRDLISTNVNTTYRTLRSNDLALTLNSSGNYGFNDYPENAQGDGASLLGSKNLLFEGALMIGTAAGNLVNVARGADTDNKDTAFSTLSTIRVMGDSVPSGIRAVTEYSDRYDPYPVGVHVRQHAYQSADDSVRNVVIACYDITNRNDTTLSNVHAALFFDWDIGPNGQQNVASWDAEHGIGRVRNVARADLPVVGVSMMSPYVTHYFAVDNDGFTALNPGIYDHFLRGEKWVMMSNGIARTQSAATDASMVIGGGPFNLAPGETRQICFGIAAGYSESSVTDGLAASRRRAIDMGLYAREYTSAPQSSRIVHIEGGPTLASGATSITFSIHFITGVELDVVDMLGRTVATLYSAYELAPGLHAETVDIPNVVAGNYFVRLRTATTTHVTPISIIR